MNILSQEAFASPILSLNQDRQVGPKNLVDHLPDALHGRRAAENDLFGRQDVGLRNRPCATHPCDGHPCTPPDKAKILTFEVLCIPGTKPEKAGPKKTAGWEFPCSLYNSF